MVDLTENRVVTVGTKLSTIEYAALVEACGNITRSAYVAQAVVERLLLDGYLKGQRACRHISKTYYEWGTRCDDCNTVIRGKYVTSG